jgi:hypothetical protein
VLRSRCRKLKVLKLGHFHSVCTPIRSQLDGVALCEGLESMNWVSSRMARRTLRQGSRCAKGGVDCVWESRQ